ncbi:uncharacterized protein LOC107832618 [Nicotiana tabacum]|uniref:Uncharacterized protein LOC107832618 n=2 Tax=Nicotiana TaxID=4085 RepID=A0A1S4DRC1_TOBAC|nr:PREDICTED: uncharacterized protein LOC104213574 [Nicotiana sylvestris]XP_016515962.1 PREDICTED: uncharacterized protein LOC107832618 [Nicotiana tabacum]
MSSLPEKKDFLAEENGVVVADYEIKSFVKKISDDPLSFGQYDGSSSIGLLSNGDQEEEEEGEEAQSKAVEGSLNSLASLEDALPFKRGLSTFYKGKSRSFMNLGEVKCVEEMEKEESPLNKRRRLTTASFYKWSSSSSSMPLLTHSEGENTNIGIDQEFKSSTSTNSFSSVNSTTKLLIN